VSAENQHLLTPNTIKVLGKSPLEFRALITPNTCRWTIPTRDVGVKPCGNCSARLVPQGPDFDPFCHGIYRYYRMDFSPWTRWGEIDYEVNAPLEERLGSLVGWLQVFGGAKLELFYLVRLGFGTPCHTIPQHSLPVEPDLY
jgi:hypothetical protein